MPDARSVKGEFNLLMYSNNLKESLDTIKNKKIFLVADESNLKDLDFNYIFDGFYPGLGGLIILTENKMIWGTSQDQEEHFIMTIQKSEFDNNAKTISVDARTKFISNYKSRNVIGVIPAKKAKGSIFITAHYDHLGMLGNIVFNGANDNASGVAMLLQLAESFSKKKFSNFNIVFIAFTGEEAGLVGSYQYTEEPLIPLDEIRFLVNLDLMGDGKNGIGVVNATIFQKEYKILEKINSQNSYFTNINKRGKSANSDHYFFTERGVPSFFIYSESKELAYHTPDDNFENFIPGKFNEMYKLLNSFIRSLK
jgi:Zn-dependent M28 family amino/carboxypeptidase